MKELPMLETILVEREGRVAILTVNRPDKLNALNEQVRSDLLAALDSIERDDAVGAVVLTGAGEKSFIAGADIGEFAGRTPFDQREAMRSPRIFDVMGARSTTAKLRLDRFFRNARTHTLHDPVDYKIKELGEWELSGKLPVPSFYS